MKRWIQHLKTAAAAGTLGLLMSALPAHAAPEVKWTLAYLPVPGSTYYEIALQVPQRIAKATQGRMEITANGSLIAGNRMLEAVRDGEVQLSMPLLGYYSASQPLFALVTLPGISESLESMNHLMAGEYGAAIATTLAKDYKAQPVFTGAFCPQTLFSTTPIFTTDNWNGKRIRVNNSGTALIANQLGAKPTSLAAGEVLPGLQRGVIDGVVTDSCWAYQAGFHTVVKYAADWQLGSVTPFQIVVSQEAWARLPKDLQAQVAGELKTMEQELNAHWKVKTAEMPKLWRDKGVDFHSVDAAQQKRAQSDQYAKPAFEAWYKAAQAKGIDGRQWETRVRKDLGQ